MLISSKNTFMETARIMFDQMSHSAYTARDIIHSVQEPHQKALRTLQDLAWTPSRVFITRSSRCRVHGFRNSPEPIRLPP